MHMEYVHVFKGSDAFIVDGLVHSVMLLKIVRNN